MPAPFSESETASFAFDLQVGLEGRDVPEFDVARSVGNAAILAINLRGLGEIEYGSLRLVAAHFFKIRSDVLDSVLRILADLELIKLVTQGLTIQSIIPIVPHYDDVYRIVGSYVAARPLNELENLTLAILAELYSNPLNKDALRHRLGAEAGAFNTTLEIGSAAGLVLNKRARGRDILASPLYFSGNLDGLIDIAARGETPSLRKLLNAVSHHQGMPLSIIAKESRIAGIPISPDELALLKALAAEGIIKPPSIRRPNSHEEQFVFTPAPGRVRMSASNREIYEKAMALAAAVRKGQLLPERFRINSPSALLSKLEDKKWIAANSEAAHQYANLAVLGLGRLAHVSGDRFRFQLIDVPENVDAVRMAKKLIAGQSPGNLEADNQARILLSSDESYVRSQVAAAQLRSGPQKPILSARAQAEIDQFMLSI